MYQQLAKDMCCQVAEVKNSENRFITANEHIEARRWQASPVRIICLNDKVMIRSTCDELTQELRAIYQDCQGEWFTEFANLQKLTALLAKYQFEITACAPYFFADQVTKSQKKQTDTLVWYEEHELFQFKEDERFSEALAFRKDCPDKVAVVIEKDQQILGMASASADSSLMWQIGIDVLPEFRGQGIARVLVNELKNKLIQRQIVPYYGTEFSHIHSLNVAISAGFCFGWTEIMTKKVTE